MYDTIESLNLAKEALGERFSNCKSLSKPLMKAYDAWANMQLKAENNPKKEKFASKAAELKGEFDKTLAEAYGAYLDYKKTVENIDAGYAKLIIAEDKRASKRKLEKDADKFKATQKKLVAKLDDMYASYSRYVAKEEAPKEEEKTPEFDPMAAAQQGAYYHVPPYGAPQYQYNPYQPNVNIAPVSIDISHIVENAVKSAMAKFTSAFEARQNAYLESLPSVSSMIKSRMPEGAPGVSVASSAPQSDAIVEMAGKVAEDEQFVLDKLIVLLENLKGATDKLSELSLACNEILEKQRVASESARHVNDMQRQLSRELQGVQANQKIITQDQIAVTEEQHVVFEHQKTALDRQHIITEAQKSMGDAQLAIMESQKTLEKGMRELINQQKKNGTSASQKDAKAQAPKAAPQKAAKAEAANVEPKKEVKAEAPKTEAPKAEAPKAPDVDFKPIDVEIDANSGKDKLDELQADE